ncbi:TIR domain-containing protein [Burkholderia cenocepacia]|uniref:TIR domain-containing protein n=1 Tax=Burkholderia cenocepacia TaxID=95486 RepID=UPI002B247483|nr:TIR domain-containing protein [Burkholderia cenocepacia]MEB2606700.1 TIR domain-containing protein [Burkholderia cenocepacia]
MQDQSPQIFISYASVDQDRVLPFFNALERDGFNIWLDCKRLKPGQNWDFEIKVALDKSSLVIAFLSEASVGRRGYVQRELKVALDKLSEKLVDDIYIIPILLDEALAIPEQLKGIQCISAHTPDCISRVSDALTFQLGKLGLATQRIQHKKEIAWTFEKFREEWDGLPGYEIEFLLVAFQSTKYAGLELVGDYIRGELLKYLFLARAKKLAQDPSLYNYGQDKFRRSDTLDLHCSEPSVVGKILTVQYAIHWYGAGAAHGNMDFATYSFVMEPLCLIDGISSVFKSPNDALSVLQSSVRRTLSTVWSDVEADQDGYGLQLDWIEQGTKEWADFRCFVPKDDGVDFLFPPYQVGPYAAGPQSAMVPYFDIVDLIRPEYLSAFGIEHVAYRKHHSV